MQDFTSSIRFKIVLAFGACAALMAAIGGFGIYGVSKMNGNMNDAYTGNTIPIADLADIRHATVDVRRLLRRLQVLRDPAEIANATAEIDKDYARIDKAWGHYYPDGISSDKEREIADRIKALLPQFKAGADEALAAAKAGDFDKTNTVLNGLEAGASDLRTQLESDAALNLTQAKATVDESASTFRTLLLTAIALVSAGFVGAIGVSIYLLRAITKPLDQAVRVADLIAGGKLDNDIVADSRDEFGRLLGALKKMDAQLSDTVRAIKSSTESVTVAAQEISSGNTDLSARTEEQAASLEETASSMTELTETVKQNADNARQANALATRATDMADAGNDAVQGMVSTIGQISSSSTKISEITGVIEGIAFQTNILALNAAVEAARAGEQGRGFAVVASEVRSLAQRSAAAAKEIKELIGSSVAMIQDGVTQASEVGATMGEVKQAIKQVSDIVGEIAAASEEQSRGIEQVHQAVGQMDSVTQQNAALVEQAAAAAQSLEEQAMRLKGAVSVFKMPESGGAVVRPAVRKKPAIATAPKAPATRARPNVVVQPSASAVAAQSAAIPAAGDSWETF